MEAVFDDVICPLNIALGANRRWRQGNKNVSLGWLLRQQRDDFLVQGTGVWMKQGSAVGGSASAMEKPTRFVTMARADIRCESYRTRVHKVVHLLFPNLVVSTQFVDPVSQLSSGMQQQSRKLDGLDLPTNHNHSSRGWVS